MASETRSGEQSGSPVGRQFKVERVIEEYVPGGAAYWLVCADEKPLEPLVEGQILEVVKGPDS